MSFKYNNIVINLARPFIFIRCGLALLAVASSIGCRTIRTPPPPAALPAASQVRTNTDNTGLEQKWGVRVENLRLSAHGHLLDLRYRAINADKAAVLGDPKSEAFLIHEATGVRLKVPNMPKVGALRSTATRLTPGTIYVMLFANQGQVVKANDLVTLEIGACRIEHLKAQ